MESEREENHTEDDEYVQKAISCKRMKLGVPNNGFVRRSSRMFKGKREEYHETDDEESCFQKLQVNTLRKYKRHYGISTPVNASKHKLATIVANHFNKMPIEEPETIITYFIHFVKSEGRQGEGSRRKRGRKKI